MPFGRLFAIVVYVALGLWSGPQGALGADIPQVLLDVPRPMLRSDQQAEIAARMRALLDLEQAVLSAPTKAAAEVATEELAVALREDEDWLGFSHTGDSRFKAHYLSASLGVRYTALGWEAMEAAALEATALERALAAHTVFFGGLFPGEDSFLAQATGDRAEVTEEVLFTLQFYFGDTKAPGPAEHLAFQVAQLGMRGDTARAAVAARRVDARHTPAVLRNNTVQALQERIEDTAHVRRVLSELDLPNAGAITAEVTAVFGEIEAEVLALQAGKADIAAILMPKALTVAEVQAALDPDQAVVLIAPASPAVLIFAVTKDGFQVARAPADYGDLMLASGRLREAMGWPEDSLRGAAPLPLATPAPSRRGKLLAEARALYRALLEPVEATIGGRRHLMVAATATVGLGVPFEMLLTSDPVEGAGDADQPWLVRRHAVTVLPALELLDKGFEMGGAEAPPMYLGFGAPDFAEPSVLGRSNWATRMLAGLAPLPDAAGEVQDLAAAFGEGRGMAVTGGEASELFVHYLQEKDLLKSVSVLHFATHGLVYGDHQSVVEPLIALTPKLDMVETTYATMAEVLAPWPDGALEAQEVERLDLAAKLVILSACSSARAGFDTDGLTSLSAAFLKAGAQRVLGTHWPVQSEAAVAIVTGMMSQDLELKAPSLALQEAVLAEIDKGGPQADPAWWAGFSLIGPP